MRMSIFVEGDERVRVAVSVAAAAVAVIAWAGLAMGARDAASPAGAMGTAGAVEGEAGRILIVADDRGPMDVLAEFLRREGGFDVTYVEQEVLGEDLAAWRAVFMYIHGAMTARTERVLIDYAVGGGRLIVLHHGIASARVNNPAWLKLAGIHLNPRDHATAPWRVVGETTHTIVNLRPGHYVTSHKVEWPERIAYRPSDGASVVQELPAIALSDTEVFLNQHFTDGRVKTVLLGFHCVDPATGDVYEQDRGGWYKPAGKWWFFYFQAGHKAADFANRNYAQILLNAVMYEPVVER
jgi:hypothetical protein